ncbi:tetratricopeptide repeat protein [Aurantimonas marina]|uniref:tetratricopeptide repeat protein n=1 Tax=Aurantimonas marina TaxID=2780508 RepID=UPI0019CFCC10|nr:tetratricopeptide repeat protein [Aurantimonas marina]
MSDDSFFREVSDELRQDKVKAVWTKFGTWIFAAVVLAVAITAGVVGWDRYRSQQANASGDSYLAALDLAREGKRDEAVAALQTIAVDGYGAYPDLARMSIGGVLHEQDKPGEAVAAFDDVTNDSDVPQPIRDMAAVRAAYILVDSGTLEDVRSRVERLTGDSEPLRFPAREAIALAAWKAGDRETARQLFQQLLDDAGAPNGIAGRARMMLEVIAASDPVAASAPPAASPDADAPGGEAAGAPPATQPASGTDVPEPASAAAPAEETNPQAAPSSTPSQAVSEPAPAAGAN